MAPAAALFMGVLAMAPADPPHLSRYLPEAVQGWTRAGEDSCHDADDLFDLIDGGAEVYRALNVKGVLSRRYVRSGFPDVLGDIFEMATSADAYGAFHHDMREGPSAGIGQESELLGGALHFWKDRFFVSIVPLAVHPAAAQAALALGRAVAAAIPGEGSPPLLAGLLPAAGLVKAQVHFFHDQELLERHYALPPRLLGLSPATSGMLARYRWPAKAGGEPPAAALVLLCYPAPAEAAAACRRLLAHLAPATEPGAGPVRRPAGTWAGALVHDCFLAGVLEAAGPEQVEVLLREARAKIQKTGNPGGKPEERRRER